MEEQNVMFSEGVSSLAGARSCRVLRLAPAASAVLLTSLESSCPPLVLGCVRHVLPEVSLVVSAQERTALGLSPDGGGTEVEVLCRMTIPDADPLSSGFDLSRLVLVASATGRALEVARPGAPVVALRQKGAQS